MPFTHYAVPANADTGQTPQVLLDAADVVYYVKRGSPTASWATAAYGTLAEAATAVNALGATDHVTVVIDGEHDGESCAAVSFQNSSVGRLSLVSATDVTVTVGGNPVLIGSATRGTLTPAIKLTGRTGGGASGWDLSALETTINGRGWTGTKDVTGVSFGYTPFANRAKAIPSTGLVATGADGFLMGSAAFDTEYRTTEYETWLEESGTNYGWAYSSSTLTATKAAAADVVNTDEGVYCGLFDSSSVAVITTLNIAKVDIVGLRVFGVISQSDKRMFSLNASNVLVQDCEFEGIGDNDFLACVNGGGAGTGVTWIRNQWWGHNTDGSPFTVFGGGGDPSPPGYEYVFATDCVSHFGWQYKYHPGASASGDTGLISKTVANNRNALGACHAAGVDDPLIRKGFVIRYNSQTPVLGQIRPTDDPTDRFDATTYNGCFEDCYIKDAFEHSILSSIGSLVFNRVVFDGCDEFNVLGGAANDDTTPNYYMLNCVFRVGSAASSERIMALVGDSNVVFDGCTIESNGIAVGLRTLASGRFSGDVAFRNTLIIWKDKGGGTFQFEGDTAGGFGAPPSVSDALLGISGSADFSIAFTVGPSGATTQYNHTGNTAARTFSQFQSDYPNATIVGEVNFVPGSSATLANLSPEGVTALVGAGEEGNGSMGINGEMDDGTFGAFKFGGPPTTGNPPRTRSRTGRTR